jgi:hypothetical protein
MFLYKEKKSIVTQRNYIPHTENVPSGVERSRAAATSVSKPLLMS